MVGSEEETRQLNQWYGYYPINDRTRPDVDFCIQNCHQYGRGALDAFRTGPTLAMYNSGIGDCLRYCNDPCNLQSFTIVWDKLNQKIVVAENTGVLLEKILKELTSR